jgi:intracellular sulfur oxidation DsrE/DsrF family protein
MTMIKILRRQFVSVLAVAAALAVLIPAVSIAQTSPAKNKVVFQVSDGDSQKWGLVLNNARNMQEALGGNNVKLEIVAFGPGVAMLKVGSSASSRVAEALKSGVKIVACENTMKAQKLAHNDMLPDIGFVPSGVVELMKKQQEGYAYIRP